MRGGAAVQSLTGARNGRSDCSYHDWEPLDRLFLAVKGDKRIFSFSWRATGGQTDFFKWDKRIFSWRATLKGLGARSNMPP